MAHAPSAAEQDYLKQIYLQREETGKATTQDLATRLGVKPSSVTAMLKHLAENPEGAYVNHTPYHGVELTNRGMAVALEMLRHHRLIELFLSELLGMPWDRLHAEAERLEHVLSEELEERIAAKLGHPAYDPHGDPIPSREGKLPPSDGVALDTVPEGKIAIVERVPDGDPTLLQYLRNLGLIPGTTLLVESVSSYGDVMTLRIGETRQVVGATTARRIQVCPQPQAGTSEQPENGGP